MSFSISAIFALHWLTSEAASFIRSASRSMSDMFSISSAKDSNFFILESRGLPEKIRKINLQNDVRIPMKANDYVRSLNLSNSVAIGLFEALRQSDFANLI